MHARSLALSDTAPLFLSPFFFFSLSPYPSLSTATLVVVADTPNPLLKQLATDLSVTYRAVPAASSAAEIVEASTANRTLVIGRVR